MELSYKVLKSDKGSTIVLVLLVMLILTTLGIVSLSLSLSNVKMAGKYRDSTQEYYNLEKAAEQVVAYIDGQLSNSQESALEYMRTEKYNKDIPSNDLNNPSNQGFFHKRWKEFVFDPTQVDGFDLHGNYKKVTDIDKYTEKMEQFFQPAFNRLYFNYSLKNLNSINQKIKSNIDGFNGKDPEFECNVKIVDKENKKYGSVTRTSEWKHFEYEADDVILKMNISDKTGRKLSVNMKVKPPMYGVVENTQNVSIQGNPIWANAITANGDVRVEGESEDKKAFVEVYGDIFAAAKKEGSEGISVDKGTINLYGNAYTKDNIQVASGSSKILVHKYDDSFKRDLKSGIYDRKGRIGKNEVFFYKYNDDIFQQNLEIDKYIEGKTSGSAMPVIFRDYDGGNVYCNNLIIKYDTSGASIEIDNNVWTKNDIINDSRVNSSITVKGDYVGITPPSTGGEGGSCIVNNIYNDSYNEIKLQGRFIVPGRKVLTDIHGKKYETLESVSANNWNDGDFLKPYMSEDGTPSEVYTFRINGETETYKLITDKNKKLEKYREYIKNKEASSEDKNSLPQVYTNIVSTMDSPEGYVSGAALLRRGSSHVAYGSSRDQNHKNNVKRTKISKNYMREDSSNASCMSNLIESSSLKNIFDSKTKYLGLFNINPRGLVNPSVLLNKDESIISQDTSGIRYLKGRNITIPYLSGCGIIYADGNLNIEDGGTFNGTIICTGDVTISGGVSIRYDEDYILQTLKNYPIATKFFKPGQIGDVLFCDKRKGNNARARKIIDKDRYKLVKWKQN